MKEIPRILNQSMVQAYIAGNKIHTRQPIKLSGNDFLGIKWAEGWSKTRNRPGWFAGFLMDGYQNWTTRIKSPFGQPGDILWIRETFAYTDSSINCQPGYVYRATDPEWGELEGFKWTPSIHMPRKAARLFAYVKRVWVERIQDISPEHALFEGVDRKLAAKLGLSCPESQEEFNMYYSRTVFRHLWDSIYSERITVDEDGNRKIDKSLSWRENPYVWCCEFKPINRTPYNEPNNFSLMEA